MPTAGKQIKFSRPIRFEHLIAVSIKNTVCWNVTPCILLNRCCTVNWAKSLLKFGGNLAQNSEERPCHREPLIGISVGAVHGASPHSQLWSRANRSSASQEIPRILWNICHGVCRGVLSIEHITTHQDTVAAQQEDETSSQDHHTTYPNTVATHQEHTLPQHFAIK
jgi:hypothetical protein